MRTPNFSKLSSMELAVAGQMCGDFCKRGGAVVWGDKPFLVHLGGGPAYGQVLCGSWSSKAFTSNLFRYADYSEVKEIIEERDGTMCEDCIGEFTKWLLLGENELMEKSALKHRAETEGQKIFR